VLLGKDTLNDDQDGVDPNAGEGKGMESTSSYRGNKEEMDTKGRSGFQLNDDNGDPYEFPSSEKKAAPKTDKTVLSSIKPLKPLNSNPFAVFVASNYASVKKALPPSSPHLAVMKELSSR